MKFKVEKNYNRIDENLVINPENCEVGILQRYIDVDGNYREIISNSFQLNSPTSTPAGWKGRYKELFHHNSQTKDANELYPIGAKWRTECRLGFYTIEAIIQVLGEKLYVISDSGHHGGLFGINHRDIDGAMERLEYHKRLPWD